jgi:hypothetical protein
VKRENNNLLRRLAEYESLVQTMKAQIASQLMDTELRSTSQKPSVDDDELNVVKAENARLTSLAAGLESEIERLKDTAHEQRIRALDLKHDLRDVSSNEHWNLCVL